MKRTTLFLLIALLSVLCARAESRHEPHAVSGSELRRGFAAPPDSIRIAVYWYWISGNISEEGVVRDLEAMKRAGIGRAFIGNIGLSEGECPQGPVRLFSPEWWKILHTALRTAGELDIELGIFNSPGWSQAGGPWIAPGQSMRYLAAVQREVAGPGPQSIPLPAESADFQDVKVLAFPHEREQAHTLSTRNATVAATPALPDAARLLDGDPATELPLRGIPRVTLEFTTPEPFTLRSLRIDPAHHPMRAVGKLQVETDAGFETVARFAVDRSNPSVDVGFDPYAPVQIGVPETVGRRFRLTLSRIEGDCGIREIGLSSRPKVERYPEKTLAKMHQTPLPYWHEYQWAETPGPDDPALAVDPATVLDLTSALHGDTLRWDVPAGEWRILRLGMRPTGSRNGPAAEEGTGLEVDKLTDRYLEHHFDAFVGAVLQRIPPEERRSLKVVVADSYEKGGQNFTDTFLADFRQRYGYDATPYLPAFEGVVVGSRTASDRFLWDVRRLVADKLAYAHIGGLREIAHRNGLTLWLENYGHWGFPGEFLQYGGQSDEVSGEFWSEGTLGDIENRAAASAAHIYGKNAVWAESFTCGGAAFSRYPATMKRRGDRFFAEGINSTLLHVCISQPSDHPLPGINAPFGNEFNRLNTWYPQLDQFTDYLKRVNFMLRQGRPVADLAYFIGEDAPKMTGITDPAPPQGIQFDYINAEVILRDMTVEKGLLTLPNGVQYRLLVLPPLETMRPELLAKIERLVRQGGAVLGPRPRRSPSLENYPHADREVERTALRMWGGQADTLPAAKRCGKGFVFSGIPAERALAELGCAPDFEAGTEPVAFFHRDLGTIQLYFLTNQSEREVSFTGRFRVEGLRPELWDPVSGAVRVLPEYESHSGRTGVPLTLAANESAFIIFRTPDGASAGRGSAGTPLADGASDRDAVCNSAGTRNTAAGSRNYPAPETLASLSGPWTVTFCQAPEQPARTCTRDTLRDLSRSEEQFVRHYSGTIRYETTFSLPSPLPARGRIFLRAANVGVMARIRVNGTPAGGLWTAPYRLDITDQVRSRENRLEVEVVNTWVNRLVGDSALPAEKRNTYCPNNPWRPDSPLPPSGLIGPVVVERIVY